MTARAPNINRSKVYEDYVQSKRCLGAAVSGLV